MKSNSKQRQLGPFTVSSVGLACMNLSHAYGVPPSPEVAAALLLRAIDLGVTHFDTAALYGFGANEELVGRTLAPLRSRFTLASKRGIQGIKSESGVRRVIETCGNIGAAFVAFSPLARSAHLQENLGAANVELEPHMIALLDAHINQHTVVGERYNSTTQAEIDTENF